MTMVCKCRPTRVGAFTTILLASTALAQPAIASHFTISTPTIVQNGGNILDGDDTITVEPEESITTTTTSAIFATGENNVIDNFGVLSTTGATHDGIRTGLGDGQTVLNAGSIFTDGSLSDGIVIPSLSSVTNDGLVQTLGTDSYAVQAVDNNFIQNSGQLSTSGDDSHVVQAHEGNTVINDGTITSTGEGSYDIQALDNNTVVNNGSMNASGDDAGSISITNNGTVENTGTITVSGGQSNGIFGVRDDTVTNSALIQTTGMEDIGIHVENNGVVSNSGVITSSGDDSSGIVVGENSTVTNTGNILTTGEGVNEDGIHSADNSTVANSGSVVSAHGNSINLAGLGGCPNGSTLDLLASGFLGGAINLGTNATVNVVSGPSNSFLWDLSTGAMTSGAPTLSGSVPIFYNAATQQIATFDPSGFAGSVNALGDLTGTLSQVTGQRLDAAAVDGGQRHQGSDDRGLWATGIGSWGTYAGTASTLEQTSQLAGFALGYDKDLSADLTVGGFAGYSWSTLDADSQWVRSIDDKADGLYAGAYAQRRVGRLFANVGLSGGYQSHHDSRFVNDNLAALGDSHAFASYNSWWLSPEVAVGAVGQVKNWSIIPSAQLRYAFESFDDYTETGLSAANATVSSRSVSLLEGRAQLALARALNLGRVHGRLEARTGWQQRCDFSEDATVTLLGQTQSVGFDADSHGPFVGLDADLGFTDRLSLRVDAEATFGDVASVRGLVSLTEAL